MLSIYDRRISNVIDVVQKFLIRNLRELASSRETSTKRFKSISKRTYAFLIGISVINMIRLYTTTNEVLCLAILLGPIEIRDTIMFVAW